MGPELSGNNKRESCSAICVPCDSASGLLDQDPFCAGINACHLFLFHFAIPLHKFSTLGDFRTKINYGHHQQQQQR